MLQSVQSTISKFQISNFVKDIACYIKNNNNVFLLHLLDILLIINVIFRHSSSKKENDFVYHDKVPALGSLPELKGASLVKGIPFSSSDPDVSGPDIFARLVPMEAHETSSLYR